MKDDELDEQKLTAPTHMWTQFVCMNGEQVVNQISFIGLNYRTGVVKFYHNGISESLAKMYNSGARNLGFKAGDKMEKAEKETTKLNQVHAPPSAAGQAPAQAPAEQAQGGQGPAPEKVKGGKRPPGQTRPGRAPATKKVKTELWKFDPSSSVDGLSTNKICVHEDKLSEEVKKMRCERSSPRNTEQNNAQFWDSVNIGKIRRSNEKARLGYLMAQYDIQFEFGREVVALGRAMRGAMGN